MDGSLLDHYTYEFDDARTTLQYLSNKQIPVIPITSKTQAELEKLRVDLDNHHPFIVENGAAIYIPKGYFNHQPEGTKEDSHYWIKTFVERRSYWQAMIEQVRGPFKNQFKTFAEANITGIMEMTGLSHDAAKLAAQRQYGEPLSWMGSTEHKKLFINKLILLGANVLEGGRFIHVSGKTDKGVALTWLANLYQQAFQLNKITTVALGDSGNDIAMLEVADYAVLIRSPVHGLPIVNRKENLFITTEEGPKGWAEGVNQIIKNS